MAERLARERAALRRVATLIARGAETSEVFAAVAREVAEVIAAWSDRAHPFQPGARWPLHPSGLAARVRQMVRAAGAGEYANRRGTFAAAVRELGLHSVAGAPIIVDGAVWGLVTIASTDGPIPDHAWDRLAEFTELLGTAIANTQSRAELSASRARVIAAADETRRRLERDLHDGIQQRLVSLALKARTIATMKPPPADEILGELSLLADGLGTALDELREISHGIQPAILSEAGLGPALEALARRSAVPVELDLDLGPRLGQQVEAAGYYIASEALANAAKHAQASVIDLRADGCDGALTLSVRDDGIGGADPSRGSGIIGLKDRVEALGGTISVLSPPGHGTTLHVRLPAGPSAAARADGGWREDTVTDAGGYPGARHPRPGDPGKAKSGSRVRSTDDHPARTSRRVHPLSRRRQRTKGFRLPHRDTGTTPATSSSTLATPTSRCPPGWAAPNSSPASTTTSSSRRASSAPTAADPSQGPAAPSQRFEYPGGAAATTLIRKNPMTDITSATQAAPATLSGRIATWVTALRYEDLPEEVVERTKLLILDQLGLQLRGATLPNVQPVLRLADSEPGKAEATLAHSGARTTVSQAAWANGTLGHSAEYDDAHPLAWHTNSAVIPAALALAERENASGRDLITAVAAGIQVMGLLGAATPKMVTIGWHGSKVLGVYGAAAAAGRIAGLTQGQLVNAFGIAGSDAGGGMEYDQSGGEVKRLHAGSASRSGLEAAELAQLGLTGPPTILEGPRGLLRLFSDGGDVEALNAVWDRWLVLDTIVRFYPSVATNHAPLDAIRQLRTKHDIKPADVARIRVGLVDFAVGHGASITRPVDAISAQFSLAFSIGLQFITGHNAAPDYFDADRRTDPEILAVGDLVEPYPMPIPEGDPIFSAKVDIELKDGTTYGAYQAGFRGHPSHPATETDVEQKFRDNVEGLISTDRADALVAMVNSLETQDSVAPVTALLGVDARRDG